MPTERQRLQALLTRQEGRIRTALAAFLANTRSEATLREVRTMLERRDLNAVMSVIDRHVLPLANIIPQVFAAVAAADADAIANRMNSRVAIGFDPSNDRAAALMRASRLRFLQDFTDAQKATTRAALADAFSRGAGTAEAARAFRGSIGLTETQLDAVNNYRRLLGDGSAEALSRELRDRRFDRTVASAVDSEEPLDADQVDRMVERYRDNFITYRAENIARTEALRATSEARQESMQQVMDQADISDDQIERTWNATQDQRTRDSHAEMDGQVVIGLDTPFVSGLGNEIAYPGDPDAPPEDSINCRCVVTTRILSADEAQAA